MPHIQSARLGSARTLHSGIRTRIPRCSIVAQATPQQGQKPQSPAGLKNNNGVPSIAQKLDPLTSTDEAEIRAAALTPEEEARIDALKSYRPPVKRRRPGNALALAARNFWLELKASKLAPFLAPLVVLATGVGVQRYAATLAEVAEAEASAAPEWLAPISAQLASFGEAVAGEEVLALIVTAAGAATTYFILLGAGLIGATKDGILPPAETGGLPEAFEFTLSNDAIMEFDEAHPPPGREPIPAFISVAYDVLLFFVDKVYENKAIERFWFLETVARMPYFSYLTCLHFYETLGWWRTGGLRVIHFAEEWNELHHLLIMEALGGGRRWPDRFLGQHAAIFYYWALVICFLFSPKWSYKFSEMLETHAVSTYRQFIIENAAKLKALPAPVIAQEYYRGSDPYLFNMDSALPRGAAEAAPYPPPPCDTLHDVFVQILEDEWEHVKTMVMCQDYDLMETLKVAQTSFGGEDSTRREVWNRWAKDINEMDQMIELRKM